MADKRFSDLTVATALADADLLAISQSGTSKQLAGSVLKSYAQTGVVLKDASTGSAYLPTGTTAQRTGSPTAGLVRYNSTTQKFEGYGSAWGNLGGGAAIGDTAPSNPGTGDLWWNSLDGHLYVYYGSIWVDAFAGGEGQYLPLTGGTVSGNLGLGVTPNGVKLNVTNGGLAVQGTPSFPNTGAGWEIVSNTSSGINSIQSYNRNTSSWMTAAYYGSDHKWFTSASQTMTLDANGRLGVEGQTSPRAPLSFAATAGTAGDANKIRLWDDGASNIYGLGISSGQLNIRAGTSGAVAFFTNNTSQAMTLSASGNLLLGNTGIPGVPVMSARLASVAGSAAGITNQLYLGPLGGTLGQESQIVFGCTFSNGWGGADYTTRNSGAISYGAYNASANPRDWSMKFYTGDGGDIPTERMRINNAGSVGIGTTSPSTRLEVQGSTPAIKVTGASSTAGFFQATSLGVQDWSFGTRTTGKFVLNNGNLLGGTDVLSLDSYGRFMLGTTSPGMSVRIQAGDVTGNASGNVEVFKYYGPAASPTESQDWPMPILALRGYGNYWQESILSFGYSNDATYQTGNGVWNFRLDGVASAIASSSSTNLNLIGPGALVLGAGSSDRLRINTSGNVLINDTTNWGGKLVVTATPTSQWGMDSSGSQITLATGANAALAVGSGLIILNSRTTGDIAVYAVGGSGIYKLGGATNMVVGTSPASGQVSIGWNGSAYTVYNNVAVTNTLGVAMIRSRDAV